MYEAKAGWRLSELKNKPNDFMALVLPPFFLVGGAGGGLLCCSWSRVGPRWVRRHKLQPRELVPGTPHTRLCLISSDNYAHRHHPILQLCKARLKRGKVKRASGSEGPWPLPIFIVEILILLKMWSCPNRATIVVVTFYIFLYI